MKTTINTLVRTAIFCALSCFANALSGQAPPNLKVVCPIYGENKINIEWDYIPNSSSIEIRHKVNAGAYSDWAPTNSLASYTQDIIVNATDLYTFQVRALINGNWTNPSNERSCNFQKVWPVGNGNDCSTSGINVLTGFNQPIWALGTHYLHEGMDINGDPTFRTDCVVAPLGGIVVSKEGTGSKVHVTLQVFMNGKDEYIQLNHLGNLLTNYKVGESVMPGQQLGYILDANVPTGWTVLTSHTHLHYWRDAANFYGSTTDPHRIFDAPEHRDPHQQSPEVMDTNGDGKPLRFRHGPDKTTYFDDDSSFDNDDEIYQEADIVVEVVDPQSISTPLAAPKKLGYYVEEFNGTWKNAVRSPANPYFLTDNGFGYYQAPPPTGNTILNYPITSAISDLAPALKSIPPLAQDDGAPQWWTYQVTNTTGTNGDPNNIDGNQCWATDAAQYSATANGYQTNYPRARVNDEAKFPDGKYRVGIRMADWVQTSNDYLHDVYVNNFRPYVKQFTIEQANVVVYDHVREFESSGSTGYLVAKRYQPDVWPTVSPCADVKMKITMSEPMKYVSVHFPFLTVFSQSCTAVAGSDDKKWEFTVPKDWIENKSGKIYDIEIEGKDKSDEDIQGFTSNSNPVNVADIPKHQHGDTWLPDIPAQKNAPHYFKIADEEVKVAVSGGGIFTLCDLNPKVTLYAAASGGNEPYTFNWTGAGHSLDVFESGQYTAIVEDKNGCKAEKSAYVIIIPVNCGTSSDPNQILGPVGYDTVHWVSKNNPLSYHIDFENDPLLATAPAQKIVVEVPIDPKFQLNTFKVGGFGFANLDFEVPENRTFYQTRVDATSTTGVLVDVSAGIDIVNQKAFWILQAIDPATGLTPTEVEMGLLPINDTLTQKGEGYLEFTIKPGSSTQTGDIVTAQADIFFDQNEVVPTNIWSNKIDALPPTSTLAPLGYAATDSTNIHLTWTAQDDAGGSGVRDFELFYSRDGEPFVLYEQGITDFETVFKGQPGHDYRFYVVATDNTGNRETKTEHEIEVHTNDNPQLDMFALTGGILCGGDTIQAQWLSNRIDSVQLSYQLDNTGSFVLLADYHPDSARQFAFPVPDLAEQHSLKFKIRALDAGLNEFADSLTVNFFPKVTAEAGANLTLCRGDSVLLNATGGTTYLWMPSQGLSNANVANPVVSASQTTTYTVLTQNSFGCASTDTLRVTVNATDTVFIVTGSCIADYDTAYQVLSNQFGCDSVLVFLTPIDVAPPTAICQNLTQNLQTADTLAHFTALAIADGSADNCGELVFSPASFIYGCGETGAHTVTLTVGDDAGNTATCSATLTVADANNLCAADGDGDGYTGANDCDDANAAIHPGATEICNGLDDDCDGSADEGVLQTFYEDADGDTFGDLAAILLSCSQPAGYVQNSTDCNDADAAIHPSATELAGDGIDQNCDGTELCFKDQDDDGYRPNATATVVSADTDCSDSGEAIGSDPTGDCADTDAARFPGNPEICDGKDNDCINGVPYTEADADNDSYRICAGDCDDANAARNPGAAEFVCNQVDDDCDGATDEGTDTTPPVASCKTNVVVALSGGTATLAAATLNDGSTDACSGTTLSFSIVSGQTAFDCDDEGQTLSATLQAADAAGNTATCAASVTVTDVLSYAEIGGNGRRNATDGAAAEKFGWGASVAGTAAAFGAPEAKVGTTNKQGAAYIFYQNTPAANAWGQAKKVLASDGATADYLGNALALDASTLLVGAYGDNVGVKSDQGSAYIFAKDLGGADNWGQQKQLQAADGAAYEYFGQSAALKNGLALVGANKAKVGAATAQGAAYLFAKDLGGANNWGQQKKLTASDGAASNLFGQSVALDAGGSLAMVGTPGNLSNRGAAYLFAKDLGGADNWGQQKKLTASDGAAGDWLGASAAISANYALAGAPNKDGNRGAAYLFAKDLGGANNWGQQKKLTASDGAPGDKFGTSASIEGDYAYVGAPNHAGGKGAVYVFQKDNGGAGNWGQTGKYMASDGASGDQFGFFVSASGAHMVAGANLDDRPSKTDQGSGYVLAGALSCGGGGMAAPGAPGEANEATADRAPSELGLSCTPNPFSEVLAIEIWSPQPSRLTVTDAVGREVSAADFPAGRLRYELQAKGLMPGTYFVRLSTGAESKTARVVMIR